MNGRTGSTEAQDMAENRAEEGKATKRDTSQAKDGEYFMRNGNKQPSDPNAVGSPTGTKECPSHFAIKKPP